MLVGLSDPRSLLQAALAGTDTRVQRYFSALHNFTTLHIAPSTGQMS